MEDDLSEVVFRKCIKSLKLWSQQYLPNVDGVTVCRNIIVFNKHGRQNS